jgi:SPP1 family phage portal protein
MSYETNELRQKYKIAKRYYLNQNDITQKNGGKSKVGENEDELLRKSDSRVSNNYHQLLVDQKASYVGSVAPVFDLGKEELNKLVNNTLGNRFAKTLLRLIIDSSNAGRAWLHLWKDEKASGLKYTIVSPDQVTPIYNDNLEKEVLAIRRLYNRLNEQTGKEMTIVEFWTAKEAAFFEFESDYNKMHPYDCIEVIDRTAQVNIEYANILEHGFEDIPFVSFSNNLFETSDLDKYKGLIDVYDDIYNGFVNDVKDVQQVILVLTNYGGANLNEFMGDLRKAKAIKVDNAGGGDTSGVSQLKIDIPVEARNSLLDKTEEAIYKQGQGMNPNKVELGNNSGVAMQLLYNPLELKASALESEYRESFEYFIKLILQASGKDSNNIQITQTWERATIQNWQEKADMVTKLADVTSKQNIAKNNPLVEDYKEELKLLEKQMHQDTYEGQGNDGLLGE